MEDGQRSTDDSDSESGWCTPPETRTDSGGDTPPDMEDAERMDVCETSADEFSYSTDAEEEDGLHDMSQLGAGAVAVKLQTVHQQSYQLVGKDTQSLVQHIVGYCQTPQGEMASEPPQQEQLQPASCDDGDERTDLADLTTSTSVVSKITSAQVLETAALMPASTSAACVVPKTTSRQVPEIAALSPASTTTVSTSAGVIPKTSPKVPETAALTPASTSAACVVPKTSPHVPETSAFTPESTSSLLSSIPASLVSQIPSSGLPEVPMTGDSSTVTQYNLIQVRQDFGAVTVKGGKNLNIGGTQNIGATPTNKDEEEKPLTEAQKIRKRTASRIQSWTKDMVETDALKKVKEKLDRGATWVTIKGRPGEGKSTTAYMALKDQYNQGRQVYQVVSPEEFNEVTMACANPVVMLDDIFGDLEFDKAEWAKWRPSLRPIVDVKHPDNYTDKDVCDVSVKTEDVSEKTKVDQTQLKQTSPNKNKIIIILIGRDYVLKSSLADLGRMADYISSPQYVVEVSTQRASYERRKIWRVHAETKNIDIEESTVSLICEADCPHGFPHVCKMFVVAYENDWTQRQVQMFFQTPLEFLRNTLEKFLKDKIKRLLFMAMIKRDGKISGQDLEHDESLDYEGRAAADDLVGSYLKKEDDNYVFDHPSIYDSVSFILSTKQSTFVIENCSLSYINQRLRLAPSSNETKGENFAGETDLVANISWTYAESLARRFAAEMQRGNLLHVLSHQSLCYSDFVDLLMDCLKTRFHMRASDIVKLNDNSSRKSFCELLPSNKSHHLIKYILETENISFTQSEGRDILLGVCTNAACDILKYISGHMKLEVNATYGSEKKTPLMLAAQTRDSEFVNQILSLDPNLNARDSVDQTVFNYLSKNGLTSAVEHLIKMGVEVNQYHGPFRKHFLYDVIDKGHLEVVKLLINRGCDVDNQRGLKCAARSLNANMVRYFLDRGAVVDGSALCRACVVGNRNIVEMLFEKGATVDMMSPDGATPLLSSCKGNPAVVSYLLNKGASVTQVSNVTGDMPLHRAAKWGSTECVDLLLKAGAEVNVQKNTGDTPLHLAAAKWGSAECVAVLLKAGADVNVQNDTGDTPLHRAAGQGLTECVDVLLKAGADVNVQNKTGDTPLHITAAAGRGLTACVDVLLKAGADVNVPNNTGDTPLHTATGAEVGWESTECVTVLLKAGAKVNEQNNTGDTPLHIATEAAGRASKMCVDVLLKAGADVNVQNNTGDTPLHLAAGRRLAECVDVLLMVGADVNVQNNTGDTPLHLAAGAEVERGSTECVDVLLKAGADVNVQNNTGDAPLHIAARRESTVCVYVLLKAEADVNVQNNTGDTPLHIATGAQLEWGSTKCVQILVKAGSDVNIKNNTGDTPLHIAAEWGSTECVDLLLKAGADVNIKNNTGETPRHIAAEWGFTRCAYVLRKAGADVNVQNNTGDTTRHRAAVE